MSLDEYDKQTVTNLTQTFTAGELRNAARSYGVRNFSTMTKREVARRITGMGLGVSDVRRILGGRETPDE